MSELNISWNTSRSVRWQLLASVCTLALTASVTASASNEEHPTIWIEVGAQVEHQNPGQEPYAPPFVAAFSDSPVFQPVSPLDVQRTPRYAIGGEGKISLTPNGSDWTFSAGIRYGRANNSRRVHKENTLDVANPKYPIAPSRYSPTTPYLINELQESTAANKQSYAIADFQVGRDVGLGLFGQHAQSTVNAGLRFAQFTSSSRADLMARPDISFTYKYVPIFGGLYFPLDHFRGFHAIADMSRSFHGVGPSVSWGESVPVVGGADGGTIAFDFGVNGAVLFGRQKASIARHETGYSVDKASLAQTFPPRVPIYDVSPHITRSRSVTVPNVGGFAGISFRFPNAKVAFGYRVDLFFGAMDGGVDAHKSEDRDFHGPFATVSIGLGE